MPNLLPNNATRFETAVSQTTERVDQIPVPLRTLWTPSEVPEAVLPFLAWAYSVDIWRTDWSIERKRYAVERAIELHRLKGTEKGIAEHLALADARLKRAVTPPAKTFLMPAFSQEERERYLATFAQLRVYPFVQRTVGRFAHFTSKAGGQRKAFLGTGCLVNFQTFGRYVRTAKLWDKGVETDLTIRAFEGEVVGRFHAADYDEVILPAKPSAAIFPGTFNAQRRVRKAFVTDALAVKERMIRIPRTVDYTFRLARETYTTVTTGLDLISVEPRKIAEQHGIAQKGMIFCGGGKQFIGNRIGESRTFLPPSKAWRYLYEQWHVFDPERVIEQRKRSIHLNHTRLGIPPYTAELTVDIKGKAKPRETWRFVRGFLRSPDTTPLDRAREAVNVSKSVRDKVLLQTKTHRFPRPGDRLKVGSVSIGQLIED